jgi:hypothetical protein
MTINELLSIQASMEKNYYYILASANHPTNGNNTDKEWKNYVCNIIDNCPVRSWSELQLILRQTDVPKTKTLVSKYYKLSDKNFDKLHGRFLNGEINCEEFQTLINPINYTQSILDRNDKNDKNDKKEYNDFIFIHKLENMFILWVYQTFNRDISTFKFTVISDFLKKFGYEMEHTWNTHFNNVLDLSSLIPVKYLIHKEKHNRYGKREMHIIINQVKKYGAPEASSVKTKNKYLVYIKDLFNIYNMPAGKNKNIVILKKYDEIFDTNHSRNLIKAMNDSFHLNIDENYIVNYVIES